MKKFPLTAKTGLPHAPLTSSDGERRAKRHVSDRVGLTCLVARLRSLKGHAESRQLSFGPRMMERLLMSVHCLMISLALDEIHGLSQSRTSRSHLRLARAFMSDSPVIKRAWMASDDAGIANAFYDSQITHLDRPPLR